MLKITTYIKYNIENMNVVVSENTLEAANQESANDKELSIDVRDFITLQNNQYLVYILKVIDKFDYVLRQHIIKFTLKRFEDDGARKATSINTYIDSLEELKFIKRVKLNNNNYYMITQKGYIYLKQRNNIQSKRKPDNNVLKERIFFAQFYIEQGKDIEDDLLGLNIYLSAYKSLFNSLKDNYDEMPVNDLNIIEDFIAITNSYRAYKGIEPIRLNKRILVNYIYELGKTNMYKYSGISVNEFEFYNCMRDIEGIMPILKSINVINLLDEIGSGRLSSPILLNEKARFTTILNKDRTSQEYLELAAIFTIRGHDIYSNRGANVEEYLKYRLESFIYNLDESVKLCEKYISSDYKKFYLSSKQYVKYQYKLLNSFMKLSDSQKRNTKRDEFSSLQYCKIYLLNFSNNELKFVILDSSRNASWYREKIFEIDRILRRVNVIYKNYISAKLIIYVDDDIRKSYVSSVIRDLIKENKKNLPNINNEDKTILKYINDDKTIYFIKDTFEVKMNAAQTYLEKGSKDKDNKIIYDEITFDKLD